MRIGIVTPAAHGSRKGNRVTAERAAGMLRDAGHEVIIEEKWRGQDWEALIALHARKSHHAVTGFRRRYPSRPIALVLTGTDLYVDLPAGDADAERSVDLADLLITLHPLAAERYGAKAMAILQSASPPPDPSMPREDRFDVAVIGHLRPVKDPFLTAQAAALLPASSKVRVHHIGQALTPAMKAEAQVERPRYSWAGALPHDETLRRLSGCRLLSLTSKAEGGANVVSEAIVCDVPVVSTRIEGSVGLLGATYPGFFEVGDAAGLAALLTRAETEPRFYAELRTACRELRPRFAPDRERAAWAELVTRFLGQA